MAVSPVGWESANRMIAFINFRPKGQEAISKPCRNWSTNIVVSGPD